VIAYNQTRFRKTADRMKISILGATGSFGKGLAYRWAEQHTIYIGSRSAEKGAQRAQEYKLELGNSGIDGNITGTSNEDAVASGEVIVLSVQYAHLAPLISELSRSFQNKIVISPITSLAKQSSFQYIPPPEGSVALSIQKMLPNCPVVAALHTIPAHKLQKTDMVLESDVPVCGDSTEAKEMVIGLIREIEHLNPIDAGPLEVSKMVEPIVPLLLNLKQYSLKRNTSVKFI
jgi:NADPH-dependent F420 reductase